LNVPVNIPLNAPVSTPKVPQCYDDVCITCSDVALPFRVTEMLDDGLAMVDTGQGYEEVSVALVDAGVGDVVLVHAKEAIARVDGSVEAPRTPGEGRKP
jgi:hydrogenase maturation factor